MKLIHHPRSRTAPSGHSAIYLLHASCNCRSAFFSAFQNEAHVASGSIGRPRYSGWRTSSHTARRFFLTPNRTEPRLCGPPNDAGVCSLHTIVAAASCLAREASFSRASRCPRARHKLLRVGLLDLGQLIGAGTGLFKGRGDLGLVCHSPVCHGIDSELNARVSKLALHISQRLTLLQHQARIGMAETMRG